MATHVITKAEAEYALDRVEFERLMAKHGSDTLLMWWHQVVLRLPDGLQPVPSPGTASDRR